MKILIVTATYPPSTNGVAISIGRTIQALRAAGHTVYVLGPNHNYRRDIYYFPIATVQLFPFAPRDYPVVLPWVSYFVWRKITRIGWDVIHVHHPSYVGKLALRIAKKCRAPVVFTYHTQYDHVVRWHIPLLPNWLHELIYHIGTKQVLERMDAIIATTRWLKKELEVRFPSMPLYFVSTAGLPFPLGLGGGTRYWQKQLQLDLPGPLFITVVRLSVEKNVSFLIRAFSVWSKLHKKGQFIVIGDGLHRKVIEEDAVACRCAHRIRFIGTIPNDQLAPWLNAADIFLYSSLTDTGSMNLVEAMSAGLPIVALDGIATRELIKPGVNGYLSKSSVSTFAQCMTDALNNREVLSLGARKSVAPYTLRQTNQQLIHVYEQVIKKHQEGLRKKQ